MIQTENKLSRQMQIGDLKQFIYFSKHLTRGDWKDMERIVDSFQDDFFDKIRTTYPLLSEDDIHIILLLRIDMSNREITRVCDILLESFRKRRYRLKKKMNIECDSIADFIRNLQL